MFILIYDHLNIPVMCYDSLGDLQKFYIWWPYLCTFMFTH